MTLIKTKHNRRSFLKVSAASSGGLMLGFSWMAGCSPAETIEDIPAEWFDINAYLSIANNGKVTIFSPNPEIGQNVKTSMPMIVAEELDVDWNDVKVKQAPLNTDVFTRQVAGGSQSIRKGWQSLRMAGATAKQMLTNAAASKWEVDASKCTTKLSTINGPDNQKMSYGEAASLAAGMEIPSEVPLKNPEDFTLIGTSRGNVDMEEILTGQPLFGLDTYREGMQFAIVLRPPAFGSKLTSYDDSATKQISGVNDVIKFGDKIAVLGNSTWAVMKGKKALHAKWKKNATLENTSDHSKQMRKLLDTRAEEPKRKDGDVFKAFKNADKIIERVYEAPFLPHNCMEPMNFFADVTAESVDLLGPIQTPERTRKKVAELLGRDESEIKIDMTRMGGGFGRRLYGDFVLEAAELSNLAKSPVKLIYSREDDMTAGLYRPATMYKFKTAIKDNKMVAYHLVGVGINTRNATREKNFPAGVFKDYLVESHNLESNITTGAWRAPITNFLAYAEQSFFDEVAVELNIDPIELRLDLFNQAKENPVGEIDYDIDRFIETIELAKEKSNWGKSENGVHQGFSSYYAHNTYVAEVAEVIVKDDLPVVNKLICAADCGVVVNPVGALNQMEGGVVDGVGHAMYGDFSFREGQPQANNFHQYKLIRMKEAPKVESFFVDNLKDPTGLGEPSLPPAGGAVANALYKATGNRFYKQPFMEDPIVLG